MKIIITDLTRFRDDKDTVCIAGINPETYECIRPMPYIKLAKIYEYNIFPGYVLESTFTKIGTPPPHVEDSFRVKGGTHGRGQCTEDEFRDVLSSTRVNSLSEGFNFDFAGTSKNREIPEENGKNMSCSIITIKIDPKTFNIYEDRFNLGKVKMSFMDSDGVRFQYVPIADLGFHAYAQNNGLDNLDEIKAYVQSAEEVYLRVGISRVYNGSYRVQVNGIYTFPGFHEALRSYE